MKKLIVGLGNPGTQYTWTRHNLGFLVIQALSGSHQVTLRNSASNHGSLAKVTINDVECSLLMPMTFMNNSGLSVKKVAEKQAVPVENILIVCDDLSPGH